MRRLGITGSVLGSLALCGIALAGGGHDIASAPTLPIGQLVTGEASVDSTNANCGAGPGEFWRLPVAAGDKVVLDFATKTGDDLWAQIYSPRLNDFQWSDKCDEPIAYRMTGSNGKAELVWTATGSGRFVLAMLADSGDALAYEVTAHVRHRTRLTINGPRLVAKGQRFTISGTVRGATSGSVLIRISGPEQDSVVARLSSTGGFVLKSVLRKTGRYTIRASYYGDAAHQPSSASLALRVG